MSKKMTIEYIEGSTLKVNGEEKKFDSKSKAFLFMFDSGMSVAEIARTTKCHYSFVYGVVSSSREVAKQEKESKSDVIRKLVDEGKTPGEIAKELNSNYSFVHSVVQKYKKEKEKVAAQ